MEEEDQEQQETPEDWPSFGGQDKTHIPSPSSIMEWMFKLRMNVNSLENKPRTKSKTEMQEEYMEDYRRRNLLSSPANHKTGDSSPAADEVANESEEATGGNSEAEEVETFITPELQQRVKALRSSTFLPPLVFHPDDLRHRVWDVVAVVGVLFAVIVNPMYLAFPDERKHGIFAGALALEYVLDIIFLLDILVTARTAYFNVQLGELVIQPRDIARNYFQGWFMVDAVAFLPVDTIVLEVNNNGDGLSHEVLVIQAVLLSVRLLRLGRLVRFLERFPYSNYILITQCILGIGLLAHWVACLLLFISSADEGEQMFAEYDGLLQKWFVALYKSLLILMGSDFAPVTFAQHVYGFIVLLVGACVYAGVVGHMSVLIANSNSLQSRKRQKLKLLAQTLRSMDLPLELVERVHRHYDHVTTLNRDEDGMKLLEELPQSMYLDICSYLHFQTVQKVPLFQGCSRLFISLLVAKLQNQVMLGGEVVMLEGQVGNHMYLLSKGSVQIIAGGRCVAVLNAHSFFGEMALLAHVRRTATVKTITTCELNTLSRGDLKRALQDYPEENERFENLAAERAQAIMEAGGGTVQDREKLKNFEEMNKHRRESFLPATPSPAHGPKSPAPIAQEVAAALAVKGKRASQVCPLPVQASNPLDIVKSGGGTCSPEITSIQNPSSQEKLAALEAQIECLTTQVRALSTNVVNLADAVATRERTPNQERQWEE